MNISQSWRHITNWTIFRVDERILLIIISTFVGICSGFAAFLLNRALLTVFDLLHSLHQHWWAFLLPALGAMLSSLFLEKFMHEGAGHGVPEVIYSVSRHGGLLRLRSAFSRLISACLTIGSGGSAGPEAPVVISGASIGSNIARYFYLNDRQRITLVGCGAAGAISSIFNAPIAGMVFAIEVIIGEWRPINIIPIAIASVAGTEVSRLLQDNQIAFSHHVFDISLIDIAACLGLGLFTALLSILLTRSLRKMESYSKSTPFPFWMRAALGGAAVGGIGIFFPDILGEGYHTIHSMIEGNYQNGLFIVAFLTLAKILATSLTLGWGGSGGVFAPCLVIGSFAGLSWHRLLTLLWPGTSFVGEGCYALIGMAGLISGILQAPLTGIFLIVEITGGYEVILPLILVSALSTALSNYVEPASFYLKDLTEKRQLLRPGTDARVLSDLDIDEVLEKDCIVIYPDMLLREFIDIIKTSHRNYFPVEDRQSGEFLGMVHLDDIRPYLFDPVMYDTVIIEHIMDPYAITVEADMELREILEIMDQKRHFSVPVLLNGHFIGMISKATILDKYRKELVVQTT
jgi:CIC family chloride channel protein